MKASSATVPTGMLVTIHKVRRRRRLVEGAAIGLCAGAFLFALIAGAIALDWQFAWTSPALRWLPPLIAMVIGVGALVMVARRFAATRMLADEAREIDRTIPALEERWSTVTELSATKRDPKLKGSPELIAKVVEEASKFEPQVHADAIVSTGSLRWPTVLCASAVLIFAVCAISMAGNVGTLLHRFFAPWQPVTLTQMDSVQGAQRVIKRSPLDIQATLTGRMPKEATLLIRDEHGAMRSIPLPVEPENGVAMLLHNVAQVDEPFSYQIQAGDAVSGWVSVQPVDRPVLSQFAVKLEWPEYTKRPVSTWSELPANIRALRGAHFMMEFSADQPLVQAALEISKQPSAVTVALQSTGSQRYAYAADLQELMQFQIIAENEFGLRNATADCRIEVVDDQAPEVKILETSQDVALNPDDTLRIDFEAKDDFGVKEAEIVATTQKEGEPARETVIPIELGVQANTPSVKKSVDLDLKQLALDPQTKLSYAVRVRDNRNEAALASNAKNGEAKSDEAKDGEAKSGLAKNSEGEPKEGDARSADSKNGEPKDGESKSGDSKTADSKAGEPKDGQSKDGESQSDEKKVASNSIMPPTPENEMSKRKLDLAGCQSCTPPKDVHIEKFSGSYDGKARDKKSVAIDAVLQGLRKAAKSALEQTEQAGGGLRAAEALDTPRTAMVREALNQTEAGKRLADNLKKESEGTPYAFFAVQTDGLVKGGLDPAAGKLRDALSGEPAKERLEEAAVSLRWVIVTLDELTKRYVSLKEVQKAEDLLQEIKEMHMVFLEDMPKWLKAGAKSPYQRNMLEVDAAFAKAYEEFLRKRRDVYMQLAELLAKHPELQARFMEASKTSTTLFRDELMRLKGEQESLQRLTQAADDPKNADDLSTALWRMRIQQLQTNTATQAAQFAKTATTWMPSDFDVVLKEQLQTAAEEVSKAAIRAGASTKDTSEVDQAIEQIDSFEDAVAKAKAVYPGASEYTKNRFEDIDKLRGSLQQIRQTMQMVDQKKFGEALQAAQENLNGEALTAATKIQQEAMGLIGLGAEVHEAAQNFDAVFDQQVKQPQAKAVESLQGKDFKPAKDSQGVASAGLERSVEALDDFIQKAIKRMDAANAKRKPGSPPPAPTLEALLKSMEEEKRSAMSLGISCQPMNIKVQTDWEQPGSSNPSSGAAQKMQQKKAETAKASAEQAARDAAQAQARANEKAKEMARQLETALVDKTAPGVAKKIQDKKANWNTVPSELKAGLLQERGQAPPKRYENAIRQYFKSIAEGPADSVASEEVPKTP